MYSTWTSAESNSVSSYTCTYTHVYTYNSIKTLHLW